MSDGLPSKGVIDRLLDRFEEDRQTTEQVRKHKWAMKSHRAKAEELLGRVDPAFVRESDLPVLALAQVHASLALKD